MKKRANVQRTAEINEDEMWAINKKKKRNQQQKMKAAEKKRAQQKAGQTTPVSGRTNRTNRTSPHGCPGRLPVHIFGGVAANEQ